MPHQRIEALANLRHIAQIATVEPAENHRTQIVVEPLERRFRPAAVRGPQLDYRLGNVAAGASARIAAGRRWGHERRVALVEARRISAHLVDMFADGRRGGALLRLCVDNELIIGTCARMRGGRLASLRPLDQIPFGAARLARAGRPSNIFRR